jgi:hypothetical protein
LLAGDRDDDLIQMPFVAASRRTLADLIGERFAELLSSLTHGLVGHANPTGRQHPAGCGASRHVLWHHTTRRLYDRTPAQSIT